MQSWSRFFNTSLAALSIAVVCAGGPSATLAGALGEGNWPALRGADGRGISAETGLPTSWSATENIAWKIALPGRGHSSPIVWDDRIFVTTAVKGDEVAGHSAVKHTFNGQPFLHPDSTDATFKHEYRLLAIDAGSGKIVWNRLAAEMAPFDDRHRAGSFASPTAVTDGERVYAYFGTPGLFAYDFDGELVWSAELGRMATLGMGVGTSPVLYDGLVIVQADIEHGDDSFIAAFAADSGEEVWRVARPVEVSWTTPLLVEHEGRSELVTAGNQWLISYDPKSGRELWRVKGLESNAIHRPLSHDDLVILTAGYPTKVVKAVRLGGEGDLTGTDHVAWTYNKGTAYVTSNLSYDGLVYLTADNGVITCLDADTGEVVYEGGRMPVPQRFFSSAVAYEGKFLMPGQDGEVFVIRAGPEFEVLGTNSMGEQIWTTPAISSGRIYIRTLEHLWAIGAGD